VSAAWEIDEKGETEIHPLHGCLQRAAMFIEYKMQRPQKSGHRQCDYRGSIVLRYTQIKVSKTSQDLTGFI